MYELRKPNQNTIKQHTRHAYTNSKKIEGEIYNFLILLIIHNKSFFLHKFIFSQ
jgi:hypothetical protein